MNKNLVLAATICVYINIIFGIISLKTANAAEEILLLKFICKPGGATLTTGSQRYTCPVTLKYSINEQDRSVGYLKIFPVSITWSSGAHKKTNQIIAYLKNGLNQEFNITRPKYPGLDIDEEAEAQNDSSNEQENSDNDQIACHLKYQMLAFGCSTMRGPMSGINSMNCMSEIYKQEARECN
jgi:hypothetical protein